jgi:imidazolonepropionase-like amidohydrolase
LLAAVLAALAPALLAAQRPQLSDAAKAYVRVDSAVIAITNVLVIDGTGGAARSGQTVVLRDGIIAEAGPSKKVKVPAGAAVVDGTGHTLIPGIVGMHDHLYYSAAGGRAAQMSYTGPRLYLGAGVTTVRTTGSRSPYSDINLKRQIDQGRVPGPRIYVTTPYLTGPGGGGMMSVVDSAEEARRFVAYWAEEGATWVKFYTTISREAMGAAIAEAHKQGIKATGHLCSVTFREAVELHIDDLAHGGMTASDFIPGKEPDICPVNSLAATDKGVSGDSPVAILLIQFMIKNGVSMTTTPAVYELFYQNRPVTDERVLSLMAPEVREAYVKERAEIDSATNWALTADGFARALAFDLAFYKAGGVLGSGVDPTGNGGALPGLGDQRGYEILIEGHFTPEQAVQVVTLNGAKILGISDVYGSIAVGKVADLVLLNGDLRGDPKVIQNVVLVFKDGIGYDSPKLIAATKGRVGID